MPTDLCAMWPQRTEEPLARTIGGQKKEGTCAARGVQKREQDVWWLCA